MTTRTPHLGSFGVWTEGVERPDDAMDAVNFSSRADVERSWRTGHAAWNELARAESHPVRAQNSTLVVAESVLIHDDPPTGGNIRRDQPLPLGDPAVIR